jgi:hypothetical protein
MDDPDVGFGYAAQEMLSSQQQALAGARRAYGLPPGEDPRGPEFAPIAGVTVQAYAEICREVQATPDGDIKMKAIAQRHGVAPEAWDQAFDGWNERLTRNVAVAEAFADSYRAKPRADADRQVLSSDYSGFACPRAGQSSRIGWSHDTMGAPVMGLVDKLRRKATLADARENIQLATETQAMWAGQLQAQHTMQAEYEQAIEEHTGPDFEPIAGIDVKAYGQICRDLEASGPAKLDEVLQRHGVAPGTWEQVYTGWNARTLRNSIVAQAINRAYRGVL